MRLTENTGRKKITNNPPSGHQRTTLSGCIFTTKACIDNQKKELVKQQHLLHMSHNMANFGPLMAEIGLPVWGTPANFNGFRVLALLLLQCRSREANQILHDVWPSPVLLHYIYFSCPPDGILPRALSLRHCMTSRTGRRQHLMSGLLSLLTRSTS